MSNPISKGIERKKEKEESEYLKEIKAKTAYKKQKEDIFELIAKQIIEEKKIANKRHKFELELQKKVIKIDLFLINLDTVKESIEKSKESVGLDQALLRVRAWTEYITREYIYGCKKCNEKIDNVLDDINDGYEKLEQIEEQLAIIEKQKKSITK